MPNWCHNHSIIRLPDENARQDMVESVRHRLAVEVAKEGGYPGVGLLELSPEQEAEVDKRLLATLGPQEPYEFDKMREFLAGTLRENVDWLLKQPVVSEPSQPSLFTPKSDDHVTRLFWGWSFTIANLGEKGVTLDFLSRWGPPVEWLQRIHECYPRWRFVNDYMIECLNGAGLIEWDGTEWVSEHDPGRYPEPGENCIEYHFEGGRLSAELRAERAKEAEWERFLDRAGEKPRRCGG